MKKAAIPSVRTGQPELDRALDALKQNMDSITGQARNSGRLQQLPSNATTAQIINRLNEIVERLQ